jgi:hypothetical protein
MAVDGRTRALFTELRAVAQDELPGLRVTLREGRASEFPADRDHAYCELVGPLRCRITVAPRMTDATGPRCGALLAHELAHALLLAEGDEEHTEREADRRAEKVFGRPIYYDGDDVQTWNGRVKGARRPRPAHLG